MRETPQRRKKVDNLTEKIYMNHKVQFEFCILHYSNPEVEKKETKNGKSLQRENPVLMVYSKLLQKANKGLVHKMFLPIQETFSEFQFPSVLLILLQRFRK